MNICSEDAMMLLVRRIEDLSGQLANYRGVDRARREAEDHLARASRRANDAETDLKAAYAKIAEWAEYAGTLRSAINAIDPKAIKRKRIVLPDWPKPIETDIPF